MKKLIFIDYDKNLLASLRRSFKILNDDWITFFESDPVKALEIIENSTMDIIITDYKMPVMNGIQLIRQAKSYNSSVKTIILSGQSENEIFETASDIADVYISKPCDFEILKEKIYSLLQNGETE